MAHHWTEEFSTSRTLSTLSQFALRHTAYAGPFGGPISRLIREGNWQQLCDYELPVHELGINPEHLMHARQALGFFTKLEQLPLGIDKEDVAYQKFVKAEDQCREINDLIRMCRIQTLGHSSDPYRSSASVSLLPSVVLLFDRARRWVRSVLGPCPRIEDLDLVLGPGATTRVKKNEACPSNKFGSGLQCSADLHASGLLPELLRSMPALLSAWSEVEYCSLDGYECSSVSVEICPGKLQFVPKNAKTYRSIVVEPLLNSILQQGIGRWIARRLRCRGLDIKDQTLNQRLAQEGSLTNFWATLDLSNASDTISTQLVRWLLPEDWFVLLRAARTSTVEYRGRTLRMEKFSSMGNGFTFPLETLLFAGLSSAAIPQGDIDRKVYAYGDDIIVPSKHAEQVIWGLTVAGFTVNSDKSFCDGPFRESCGKDYYLGFDVRPYYQKELVSYRTLFTLHNFYIRRYGVPSEFSEAVREIIPPQLRLLGPDGYGDGHLISDEWHGRRRRDWARWGYGGVAFDTFSLEPRAQASRYPGDYVSPLYNVYVRGDPADSTPVEFTASGRPLWPVPNTDGYRRTSIYTLS